MHLIGFITNSKNENYIKKELSTIVTDNSVIFINDKNLENIKNITFEILVIDNELKNRADYRKIISKAKYIILNSDFNANLEILNNLNLLIITYGFNSKATFSVSSITENNIIICLQRIINDKNKKIEPKEYSIEIEKNVEKYAIIATKIIKILYQK